MDANKVLEAFLLIADLEESEKSKYLPLAKTAITQIEAKCKVKITYENEAILTILCAALVNLWVNMASCSSQPTGSFSGNGYSISKDSKRQIEAARDLFDMWRAEAANLLVDDKFAFVLSKEEGQK